MKPETRAYLEKAQELLDRSPALLVQGFADEAGRAAYLAGFHAAQALLFERQGRSAKTHSGVQAQLAMLTKDDPRMDLELRAFLGRTYNLKAIADYETGPGSKVTEAQATKAIEAAHRFVATMASLLVEFLGMD